MYKKRDSNHLFTQTRRRYTCLLVQLTLEINDEEDETTHLVLGNFLLTNNV